MPVPCAVTYLVVLSDPTARHQFDSMGASINAACKLIRAGAAVLRIIGSEGFVMERRDIEIECSRRHDKD